MIYNVLTYVFPATFALLPGAMDTPEARVALIAIGLQESAFEYRRQHGNGPARGFWQFEKAGVAGVLSHPTTKLYARHLLSELCYDAVPSAAEAQTAIEHNDVLACGFARLLLWTLPSLLAGRGEVDKAWAQYLAAWRPGAPRHSDWATNYAQAWSLV